MTRIRHFSCLDIDLLILNDYTEIPCDVELPVRYYNRHLKIFQGEVERVTIKKEDAYKWKIIDN